MSDALTRERIAVALCALGLQAGEVLLVHSSLRSLGYVEGGAGTVVDALLDVLGPRGTLCVPAFVFSLIRQPRPVFDPANTPSEVGAISEAARRRPGARRSAHLIHSIAALGPVAEEITRVHGPSAWACDGPFGQLHHYDAKIVLLGVPYLRCTYFHVVEQLVQTPKRVFREIDARLRRPDGTLTPLPTRAFVPTPGWRNNDFNKFGALVEARGLVRIGPVGNAVTRVLRARDIVAHGVQAYREDSDLFNWTDPEYTPLRDGVLAEAQFVEKAVYDPAQLPVRWGDAPAPG
jgi:aminoglycoside 3-N-acetyltransferase